MDKKYIIADSLFASVPEVDNVPARSLLELESLEGAELGPLIDSSYYILQDDDLSKEDLLKVWEMRLVLMLFNNQLGLAKKEALNLTNALYIHENPGAAHSKPPTQLVSRSQEGGLYSKLASPSTSSTSVNVAGMPQKVVVYPLPNNNDSSIPDSLIRLLLRLKSLPNLGLVNEVYKLSYQYRLRSEATDGHKLQARLICCAYATISVLIINKNYISLLALAESLCEDLEYVLKDVNADEYQAYLSNIRMVWVWAKILDCKNKKFPNAKGVPAEKLSDDYVDASVNTCESMFQKIHGTTLMALRFVMGKLAIKNTGNSDSLSLNSLVRDIFSDKISTRIICCTLSVWDLEATYNTKLTESKFDIKVESGPAPLEKTYAKIMSQWGDNFNKLYGME